LALVYGLENVVDFFSSVVVLWRFFLPSGSDPAREAQLRRREKRASMAISIILLVLGVSIVVSALLDFERGREAELESVEPVIFGSALSLVLFGTLAAIKFHYSKCLQSASLYKDGLCSLIGTVLSGSLFVNTILIEFTNGDWWWIDPIVALICGCVAFYLGLQAILHARCRDRLPIFTLSWWVQSQGDAMDEKAGRPVGPEDYPVVSIEPNNMEMAATKSPTIQPTGSTDSMDEMDLV
jgi:hypothetical protein